MSESNPELSKRRASLKKKVGLAIAAAGTAGVGFFGVDREAKPVSAEGNTPTATVTITSTPDAKETQIAALQTVIAKTEEDRKKDKIIADLKATATALAGTPTTLPKPTDTPIPTATPNARATADAAEARRIDALGRRQAEIKETATAEAAPTVTAEAQKRAAAEAARVTPTSTNIPGSEGGRGVHVDINMGEIPWRDVAEVAGTVSVVGGILGALVKFRRGIVGWARARAGDLRRRSDGPGGGTSPVGGPPPAGGGGIVPSS